MSDSVKVGIKLKPLIKRHKDENLSTQWIVRGNSIVSLNPETKKRGDNEFYFDNIFDTDTNNSIVFNSIVKPIVDAALEGFNGTVYSYGQFNSGKTYTMIGTLEEPGIIPLSIQYIFKAISNTIGREFLLRVSYLEICNESINDLLNKNGLNLKLNKDNNEQIIIDSKEEIANSLDNMLSIMKKGIKNQNIRETNRNKCISNHSIFRITIESQDTSEDFQNVVQVSQLNLVDLAGFKKTCQIDAIEGQQIDTSLSTLESVIMQLSESQNDQRGIDYYNGKLTELLQSSLGGNSLTAIICTVTAVAFEETHYTLSFASQAKNVKNKPQKNEVVSDASLLIRYAKQLIKLQKELQRIRNGNSSIEHENIESKLQEKFQINHLLEERIKLLKTQIVSGCNATHAEPFKCKSRRRQNRYNSGTFKHLPLFQTKTGLPTIKEMSPEKPYNKSNSQLVDAINQTFQTPFTDFELDLIECETCYETKENGDSTEEENIKYTESVLSIKSKNDCSSLTPEKQDSYVQTSSNQGSPTTPKNVLRRYIYDLTKDLIELREFTTLEKQLMCEENHYGTNNREEPLARQTDLTNSKDSEINEYSSNLVIQLEEEKAKLEEDLEIKIQELDEIKNDIQSFKLGIENLQKTIYLLTNENMEMSSKLSAEKERSKQAEFNLQRTIDELYARISKVTDEKINLESDLIVLNDQLESVRLKIPEEHNHEQLFIKYQNKIDTLKTENIKLTAIITEQNKELETIKECKSLLYDHECIYKEKIQVLTEKNECLVTENSELSTDLMDKIEENDILREQCDILKNKISLTKTMNSDENNIEQLRTENTFLKTEIMELKVKVTMLTDENAKFSNNLMETMEDLDISRSERLSNNASHLSPVFDDMTKVDEKEILQEENRETLANKVIMLQGKINHLTHLNKKLSELKLSSCNQCAHLKNLNDSRRALKLEAKVLNHKLEDLQRKFDQKCTDTEVLKMKVNQELNFSFVNASLNASFTDGMNVSFVEEKVQHLNNELQTLKDDRNKLSILYKEKCDEFEKLHEVIDAKNVDLKAKKHTVKNESRIQQIQNSIDQVKEDIDELKKNSTNFTSMLNKFRTEKASLLDEISTLKSMNKELQQKVLDAEISVATATEKAHILENDLLNMSKEIEQYSEKERVIQSEKLTLEVELEDLKAEKENKDILIIGLHRTIDDLNECISSLKNELGLMTSQDKLIIYTDTNESKHKHELELLKNQHKELEKEKQQSLGAEKCAVSSAKELEIDIENPQKDLIKQESLYKELQRKVSKLESLLQESEYEKEMLKQKLQEYEVQLTDFKDNQVIKYKNELESVTKKFEESEIKLSKINETLNKYVKENYNLTQDLAKLRDIEFNLGKTRDESEHVFSKEKTLIKNNKKLTEELNTVRECIIKELKSLKHEINSIDFLDKTANEIFIIFLQTLIHKEEEVIKTMRESFDKDKQKLIDEKRQSADAEKRVALWAKELETEIEKLQMDLTNRESIHKQQRDKIYQLEHLLKESTYEKGTLKEKMETLEIDFNNLQAEFDKQCTVDIRQEEAIIIAQKREKAAQEAFKNKEIELQSKMKSQDALYEKKIVDLIASIESYKTKNMELKSNIEGLEANQKQLKNIIEANASELKMNNQIIDRISIDLEQLTKAYNEVNREVEQKTLQIENIKVHLKSKCDMLSEYKTKFENIMPDYEVLKDQLKERKTSINRYKEEVEELKMEKEKQIEIIKDKLNSEEIKNVGLNKQLNELNNKNITLVEELHSLKEECENLQCANAKLEKKVRNSTSKMKAEAEMDDLRDVNKRLQNNLEGASNRIIDLQNNKNEILKELVNLKGQYELLLQENTELKKTSSYKFRQSISCLSLDNSSYDALLQGKNRLALELEGNKLLLNQRDKEINEYINQVKELDIRNKDLDKQLEDCAAIIRERDLAVTKLQDKLYVYQIENKLVNELEEKMKILQERNKKLQDQLETFKTKPQVDMKQVEDIKLHNEKVVLTLKKENLELQTKLSEYENKLELKSNSSGSRSGSPAFEMNRRRHSRTELFNQKRQIENLTFKTDIDENEEIYEMFRKKIKELELELVSKNGQIATLEIQIQSENFPYQEKCKELGELLLSFREKNSELRCEIGRLQRAMYDINAWECDICRKWRINRRDQACQTIPNNNTSQCFPIRNGVINTRDNDHVKIMKLEKERALMKDICRSRCRRIKELEDKVKELEEAAMKDTVPTNVLELKKPLNYGRNI